MRNSFEERLMKKACFLMVLLAGAVFAGDDFKVEVLRWKKSGQKHERWAIRINNIYKFTWTQFNLEKEKLREVKK